MKKVAIVGVEGSGKTVMLAGLGELYSQPDENGFFLSPKNFATASYVADKIARMRNGEWPTATAEDVLQGLDWSLKRKNSNGGRPAGVCEISCLDFAGEVYRNAFGISAESGTIASDETVALKKYIRAADAVVVLINLRDIIVKGLQDKRVQESIWITRSILQYALEDAPKGREPRAALVLTQADSYASTIESCGGVWGVLKTHLRDVANNYDWLDAFAVSSVDRTSLDDDGNIIPADDFTLNGLKPVVDWILEFTQTSAKSRAKSSRPEQSANSSEEEALNQPPPPSASQPNRSGVDPVVFYLTLAVPGLFGFLCLVNGYFWRAGLMALLFLLACGGRDNEDCNQGVGSWLLCGLLWLISGWLAVAGHGWWALLFAGCGFSRIYK